MTPGRFLEELERRGVELFLSGAFLHYRGPAGAFDPWARAWAGHLRGALIQDWTCERCQGIARTFYGITERLCCRCIDGERGDAMSLLWDRRHWLRVETVDRPGGGWDVVLRIDGTYAAGWPRESAVAFFEEWIRDELERERKERGNGRDADTEGRARV